MPELVTIFRTRSDVEASVVRALLEAHGVPAVVGSHTPQSVFPMVVNTFGEIRIAVHADDAVEAARRPALRCCHDRGLPARASLNRC